MKKMKFMRIAAVMLILCLASTCAISGTFAKYTTEASAYDSARVAKWGLGTVAEMDITDLFQTAYTGDNGMAAAQDAIAPGTTNSADFKFVANNVTPEVAYRITVDVSGSQISNGIKNNSAITWKLDGGADLDWDGLMAAIKALSGDASGVKEYAAGTAIPAGLNTAHTISWNWNFENGTTGNATDTDLGNDAVANTVQVSIRIVAEQIDTIS